MDTGYCWIFYPAQCIHIFSSPEWKTQVSYSDHKLSIVCQHCCCSCCLHHFISLDPLDHMANFNQIWHKATVGLTFIQINSLTFFFQMGDHYYTIHFKWSHLKLSKFWHKYFKIMQGCSLMWVVWNTDLLVSQWYISLLFIIFQRKVKYLEISSLSRMAFARVCQWDKRKKFRQVSTKLSPEQLLHCKKFQKWEEWYGMWVWVL